MDSPEIFSSGSTKINAIVHHPANQSPRNKICVIFAHGWNGYRTGPKNLLVQIARSLAAESFMCVRFDYSGRGYSEAPGPAMSYRTIKHDLCVVTAGISEKYNIHRFCIIGICVGAKVALHMLKENQISFEKIVAISTPVISRGDHLKKAAYSDINYLLKGYLSKLLLTATYKRLVLGEVDFKTVISIIKDRIRWAGKSHVKSYPKASDLVLHHVNLPYVLCIHGSQDPETKHSVAALQTFLSGRARDFDIKIISGADHNFSSSQARTFLQTKIIGSFLSLY